MDDLRLALAGRFSEHHADLVRMHLDHITHLDKLINEVLVGIGALDTDADGGFASPARASGLLAPFATQIALLITIPGIGTRAATVIVSEIGVDMAHFPSAAHLAAWAGLAPANNESGGKRRRGKRRKGNTHVTSILVEVAGTVARSQNRLGARFRQLNRRFGGGGPRRRDNTVNPSWKRASFATAHTLIKIIYHVLATGQPYQDLGADFYERTSNPDARVRGLVDRLERLTGKKITISEEAAGQRTAA
jgi:hypothetical protein